jgi:hypothetical protein
MTEDGSVADRQNRRQLRSERRQRDMTHRVDAPVDPPEAPPGDGVIDRAPREPERQQLGASDEPTLRRGDVSDLTVRPPRAPANIPLGSIPAWSGTFAARRDANVPRLRVGILSGAFASLGDANVPRGLLGESSGTFAWACSLHPAKLAPRRAPSARFDTKLAHGRDLGNDLTTASQVGAAPASSRQMRGPGQTSAGRLKTDARPRTRTGR